MPCKGPALPGESPPKETFCYEGLSRFIHEGLSKDPSSKDFGNLLLEAQAPRTSSTRQDPVLGVLMPMDRSDTLLCTSLFRLSTKEHCKVSALE